MFKGCTFVVQHKEHYATKIKYQLGVFLQRDTVHHCASELAESSRSSLVPMVCNMHVFGLWVETGGPKRNPHKQGDLLVVRNQVQPCK